MLQYLNQKRGQSTLEYALLIVIIIAALLSIQFYLKRAEQGNFKKNADDIGDQYSDGNTNVLKTVTRISNTVESFNAGVASSALVGNGESTNSTENSVILNTSQEYFGN